MFASSALPSKWKCVLARETRLETCSERAWEGSWDAPVITRHSQGREKHFQVTKSLLSYTSCSIPWCHLHIRVPLAHTHTPHNKYFDANSAPKSDVNTQNWHSQSSPAPSLPHHGILQSKACGMGQEGLPQHPHSGPCYIQHPRVMLHHQQEKLFPQAVPEQDLVPTNGAETCQAIAEPHSAPPPTFPGCLEIQPGSRQIIISHDSSEGEPATFYFSLEKNSPARE